MKSLIVTIVFVVCNMAVLAVQKQEEFKKKVKLVNNQSGSQSDYSLQKVSDSLYHYRLITKQANGTEYNFVIKSKHKLIEASKLKRYLNEEEVVFDGDYYQKKGNVLLDSGRYVNHHPVGKWILRTPSGLIKRQSFYTIENACLLANRDYYNPDGRIQRSAQFKDKRQHGEELIFNKNGDVVYKSTFEDGKVVRGMGPNLPVTEEKLYDNLVSNIQKSAIDKGFFWDEDGSVGLQLIFDEQGNMHKARLLKSRLSKKVSKQLSGLIKDLPSPGVISKGDDSWPYIINMRIPLSEVSIASKKDTLIKVKTSYDWYYASDMGWCRWIKIAAGNFPEDVDLMPEFPGGAEALRRYISTSLKYPLEAQKNRQEGRVYVSFVVNEDGSITNAKIARGVSYYLDREAYRVVMAMPNWKPGIGKNGHPVKVNYTVPINFILQ